MVLREGEEEWILKGVELAVAEKTAEQMGAEVRVKMAAGREAEVTKKRSGHDDGGGGVLLPLPEVLMACGGWASSWTALS